MKALVCEMCGSNDFLKDNGVFICQSCGTKHTIEEAKKLMMETNGDIASSVIKNDSSAELDKLKILARRAFKEGDYQNAADYYEKILLMDTENVEALMLSACSKAYMCKIAEISMSISAVENRTVTVLGMMKNVDQASQSLTLEDIVREFNNVEHFLGEAAGAYLINNIGSTIGSALDICTKSRAAYERAADHIAMILVNDFHNKELAVEVHKKNRSIYNVSAREYAMISEKIYRLKPEVTQADKAQRLQTLEQQSKCYVATAVYGSYDCPEVWTLRRFRDHTLAKTWYGRCFIHSYYAVSPMMVRWFGHYQWFRDLFKPRLDKLVAQLNNAGVLDSPYQDMKW